MTRTLARKKRERVEVETPAYMQMMRRMIRAAGRRVAMGDIEDIARMIDLRNLLDQELRVSVQELHAQGESWARIGRGAGISRQAAEQRWGK